jgi:spermidine/putrescine transport system ATP-binding protein
MTMADTIAVMNKGVIEQQGEPTELYDNPATTFVSNFLGQSNLVRAEVIGRSGDEVVVDAQGSRLGVPTERAHSTEGAVWAGIRPEKVYLAVSGAEAESASNVLGGDVSYIGVSTQYLVRMPWGQELTVFEQNTGARAPLVSGAKVDLHWRSAHTFLLDAAQDASAGAEVDE